MHTYREDLLEHAVQTLILLGDALDVDMSPDESGACFFEHSDGWRVGVMLAGEDQIVTAVSVLSNVTPPADDRLSSILSDFNWMGARTGGAAFSWNPAGRSFALWSSRDADAATADGLHDALVKLVETAADLQPDLRAQLEGTDNAAPAARGVDTQRV